MMRMYRKKVMKKFAILCLLVMALTLPNLEKGEKTEVLSR